MAKILSTYTAGKGPKYEVKGVKGEACLKLTEELLKEKGGVETQKPTAEMSEQPGVVNTNTEELRQSN